jgi:gas vesicle structural protein
VTIRTQQDVPLVELVDRLLNRGVVLAGQATISVAGVELIYLGINVVLAAADKIDDGTVR